MKNLRFPPELTNPIGLRIFKPGAAAPGGQPRKGDLTMISRIMPKRPRKTVFFLAALCLGLMLTLQPMFGQYFGRNKVQYEKFDYKVLKTEHFDVYFYPEEEQATKVGARMAERWYKRYARLFNYELRGRQALIMYASHPQFEQTTVLSDIIGEGTGGVTESMKRRIIVPFAGSLEETDHVIGHELVHAFQYDMAAGQAQQYSGQSMGGLERAPLWVVEGMAEYLSIGPVDSNTAMWMRDVIKKKKMPTIKDLRDPYRYFPYRYGQAVLAYIGGRWGDLVVVKILKDIIRGADYEKAMERALGINLKKLSEDWQAALKKDYSPYQQTTQSPTATGRLLVKGSEYDPYNVAPVLSPDGKKFVYISSRDLFSLDMFIGDAKTGKMTRRITRTSVDPHFQSIQFINSAGSWDMTGKQFVFGAVSAGKPVLALLDVEGQKISEEIKFPELGEILNPTWSPDGKKIAFSGLAGGYTDLYIYDLETKKLKNMTGDPYGDIHPVWSPDGRTIAFVTERFTTKLDVLNMGGFRLALMDPESGEIKELKTFDAAKSVNPQWSSDSKSLHFISDQNGIPNVYRLALESGNVTEVTNLYTGVSGITQLSPALSIAAKTNDLLYSVYDDGNFSIYTIEPPDLLAGKAVEALQGQYSPAVLPPKERSGSEILGLLKNPWFGLPDATKFGVSSYKPKLTLDFATPPQMGVGVDRYGTYGGGGITLFWSDMLGFHNLATMVQVYNRLEDSSFLAQYVNSRNRLNWGAIAYRIPYAYGGYNVYTGTVFNEPAYIEEEVLYRQIYYQIGGFASYPFSQMQRFELSGGLNYIDFNNVVYTRAYSMYDNSLILDEKTKLPSPPGLAMAYASAALVYDSAFFGATAPILGQSYRLEASPTVGSLKFYSLLGDYRRYLMPVKPFTLAFRAMTYGRYGKGSDDERLYPMFLGYDTLVRGYNYGSFTAQEVDPETKGTFDFNRLWGSRLMVANFELRFPLFGALGIGKGFYGIFPLDFLAFYDVGVAWDSTNSPRLPILSPHGVMKPISSAGVGLRVNLLGYLVLGVNYVYPFDRPLKKSGYWQFSFYPGY